MIAVSGPPSVRATLLRRLLTLCLLVGGLAGVAWGAEPTFMLTEPSKTISLEGAWLFHQGDRLEWAQTGLDEADWDRVQVPKAWAKLGYPRDNASGWYRLHFSLNLGDQTEVLGVNLGQINDSDETYLNGHLIGSTGEISPQPRSLYGKERIYALPEKFLNRDGENVLAVRVWHAAYLFHSGGITAGRPALGPLTGLLGRSQRQGLFALIMAGMCLIIGLYHLPIYLRLPKAKEYLYFILLCFDVGSYMALRSQLRFELCEDILILKRLEYLSLLTIPIFAGYFFDRLFAWRRGMLVQICTALLTAGSLILLIAASLAPFHTILRGFNLITLVLVVYYTVRLVRQSFRPDFGAGNARIVVGSLIIFFAIVTNDTLINMHFYSIRFISGMSLTGVGFMFVIFSLSVTLGNNFINLYERAITDGLTQLVTRPYVLGELDRELERYRRYGHPVSLILLDLDHFKALNERFGHLAGDHVLVAVARYLTRSLRKPDLKARFGGEEFLIMLPETTREQAYLTAERLRKGIAALEILHQGTRLSLEVSLGVVTSASSLASVETLVQAVDSALTTSKRGGRNRTTQVDLEPPTAPSESTAEEDTPLDGVVSGGSAIS